VYLVVYLAAAASIGRRRPLALRIPDRRCLDLVFHGSGSQRFT
jgi:hypothetical protein